MTARQQIALVVGALMVVVGVAALSWEVGLIVAGLLLAGLTLVSEF